MKRPTKLAIALSAAVMLAGGQPVAAGRGDDRGSDAVIEVTVSCDSSLIQIASVAPAEGVRPHAINHVVLVHDGGETKVSRPTDPAVTRQWVIDAGDYPGLTTLRVKAANNGPRGGGESFDYAALVSGTCDSDGDGIPLGEDNCPLVPNTDQDDLDMDGKGDVCDSDADGDGFVIPGDCDDRDPAVNRGAVDEPGNGIDEDCDGTDAELPEILPVPTAAPLPDGMVFRSDFSGDDGWQTTGEWQIGTAQAAPGTVVSPGGDPGADASADDSNVLAGANIGGTVSTRVHDYYWLTSPVIDLRGEQPALLRYQRWLNSDYTPYMNNVIEINDGRGWTRIWQSGSQPGIKDREWKVVEHDLSGVHADTIQIRFGYNVGSIGGYTMHGWNLDDVEVITVG